MCRRKEGDSFCDLIPLDISWLGECDATPCFMELAWIISLDEVLPRGTAEWCHAAHTPPVSLHSQAVELQFALLYLWDVGKLGRWGKKYGGWGLVIRAWRGGGGDTGEQMCVWGVRWEIEVGVFQGLSVSVSWPHRAYGCADVCDMFVCACMFRLLKSTSDFTLNG